MKFFFTARLPLIIFFLDFGFWILDLGSWITIPLPDLKIRLTFQTREVMQALFDKRQFIYAGRHQITCAGSISKGGERLGSRYH
jgi:hypothetical protein